MDKEMAMNMETKTTKDGHRLKSNEDIKYTTCYMCACRCGIKVSLRDEKIVYIQGNMDHPTNQGVICAKGSSGIMKQFSPGRITKPLLRRAGMERGSGEYEEISWSEAMEILVKRLKGIRGEDPKKLAFYTGRDQMQALTGYWAKQFGTPNFAAHGGFCSVNMAAGMIYSMGGTSWEFGGPDFEMTKYLLLFGVAEDHDSNPMKLGLSKVKNRGGKVVVINPIRSGYGAIADEWVAIRPGTDGAFIMGLMNVLVEHKFYDKEFLLNFTNASYLVELKGDEVGEGEGFEGLLYTCGDDKEVKYVYDEESGRVEEAHKKGVKAALLGTYKVGKRNLKTVMQCLVERVSKYTPESAEAICGVPAEVIRRIGIEVGVVAQELITLEIPWTDAWGTKHENTTGRPVSLHGMRGLAAHTNGFQTIRALSAFMMLLGIIDRPGGFRYKPPFPKPIPPAVRPVNNEADIKPNKALPKPALGFPASPEDLMIDEKGGPIRLDKAFSWEFPLTAHGMLQNVITNAHRGDPYKIDTLILFMANMAWNSSMNTSGMLRMLTDKEEDGEYKIPFIVVSDAFYSEQVAYADLVLPDTTYLERFDCISMLDRPISEYDAVCDSIRHPIMEPKGECRAFQQTLIDLAGELGLEGFCDSEGKLKYKTYEEFITKWETVEGGGVGFLSGWRGADGAKQIIGEPNEKQLDKYIENKSFYRYELEDGIKYNRNINKGYLEWATKMKLIGSAKPIVMNMYSEVLESFRISAEGDVEGRKPQTQAQRERILRYFDPLPFWYESLEPKQIDKEQYSFYAITQRPMPMYHSWDGQNAWLRQIVGQNYLYINPKKAKELGIEDEDWVWVESSIAKIRVQVKYSEAHQPDTVWTWNGVGKKSGFWGLKGDVAEAKKGFLLNHLIREELKLSGFGKISNSDPITGQAGWYDLRVKIYKAEEEGHYPEYESVSVPKHMEKAKELIDYGFLRGKAR